ncbi:hypothetical protein WISP_137800 [Willisornis vidua]|uniref:Uncharacterized protein n=1 Tax=Willisornis vidua TaxID=1566151 RepID=A0ABQ9CMQ7_9PASS|nr:hypothetical protein WISP_137800 [Willisornis vidua]
MLLAQGMRHILPVVMRPHNSSGNTVEKDGCMGVTGKVALRPSSQDDVKVKMQCLVEEMDDYEYEIRTKPDVGCKVKKAQTKLSADSTILSSVILTLT